MTKQTSKKTKATILELQPLTQSLKARGPVRFLRQDESGQLYLALSVILGLFFLLHGVNILCIQRSYDT